MLERFHSNNYKSLIGFELPLCGQLTIIAGANGVGKTSVCHAMELSLELTGRRPNELLGDENEALISNKWTSTKRLSFGWDIKSDHMSDSAHWSIEVDKKKHWGVAKEDARHGEQVLLKREWRNIRVWNEALAEFSTERKNLPSYLSTLDDESEAELPSLWAIRCELVGRYVPFLNPVYLRKRSRDHELGPQGENFARYIHELKETNRRAFRRALEHVVRIFPAVKGMRTKRTGYGWTELEILQLVEGLNKGAVFKAAQVNDGLLRILALATAPYAIDDLRLLVIEEPENGMHPRLLEMVLDLLRQLPVQVVLTTHSPVLLNFARPEEVVVMKSRGAKGPLAVRFVDLKEGMRRRDYFDVGDVLYHLDDERLFRGLGTID